MTSYWQFQRMNSGMVGKLQVKPTSHWQNIDNQHWVETCEIEEGTYYYYRKNTALVRLQHALVAAGKCEEGNMILAGELYKEVYNSRWIQTERKYFRTPYHKDLLENYGEHSLSG